MLVYLIKKETYLLSCFVIFYIILFVYKPVCFVIQMM